MDIIPIIAFTVGITSAWVTGWLVARMPAHFGWYDDNPQDRALYMPGPCCDGCGHALGFRAIPMVGRVLGKSGKCPSCGTFGSTWYPISELFLGVSFLALTLTVANPLDMIALALVLWASVTIAAMDWKHFWIPRVITLPMMWAGLLVSPFEPDAQMRIVGAAGGGGLIWGALVLVVVFQRRRLIDIYAGGDVAFCVMAGAWLGLGGLLEVASIGAGIFILQSLWMKHWNGTEFSPFGPALSVGFVAASGASYLGIEILPISGL